MSGTVVLRDGRPLVIVRDENAAFAWLLDHQPQSVQWATTHEGYEIREVRDDVDEIDLTAQLMIRRLLAGRMQAPTRAQAEAWTIEQRDRVLGVAAWCGIEDKAWDIALAYLDTQEQQ